MLRLIPVACVLATLLGCELAAGGGATPPVQQGTCPSGMSAATWSSLQLTDVRLDGIAFLLEYDPSATYLGQAAACVSATGDEVQYVVVLGDEPQGILSVAASDVGEFDLSYDTEAALRIWWDGSFFETGPIRVSTWETESTLFVDEVGPTFRFTLSGAEGINADGQTVFLNAYGSVGIEEEADLPDDGFDF